MERLWQCSKGSAKTIKIRNLDIPYHVEHRKVKYPRLEFKPDKLLVILPHDVRDETKLLHKKNDWIWKKVNVINRQLQSLSKYQQNIDKKALVFGEFYDISFGRNSHGIKVNQDCIEIVASNQNAGFKYLQNWLKERLREKIVHLIDMYTKELGIQYRRISIRKQKTKWASCSSKQNLSFNLRLAALPDDLIKYTVLHETTHLVKNNHSKEFWKVIEKFCPDWRKKEALLTGFWFLIGKNKLWKEFYN